MVSFEGFLAGMRLWKISNCFGVFAAAHFVNNISDGFFTNGFRSLVDF